jgi:alanine racemase
MENLSRSGATLTIDLAALRSNYRLLARKSGKAVTGAAIKGEAYGLGLEPVARTLWDEGCRDFFVARPDEGEVLRAILKRANIYILDGLYPGETAYYLQHNLRPALTTLPQAREWAKSAKGAACAFHVDTGINRVGMTGDDYFDSVQLLKPALLMSHLACADDFKHPMNKAQWLRFGALRKLLPHVPASFANSSGIYLGEGYHFDMTRPGVALYGGNPTPHKTNPMKPVAQLDARVLQVREVRKGETVGYSATWTASKTSRIAIIAAGYRDGIPRKLSSSKPKGPAHVFLGGQRCPIIGRVSMDMTCVDASAVPERKLARATSAEFFGRNISVDEAAGWAGTISYELLTHLGNRYTRVYSP